MSGIILTGFDEGIAAYQKLAEIPTADQMNRIAQYAVADIRRNFETNGANAGYSWAPNKPSTIAAKGSSKPLTDDGFLKGSIAPRVVGTAIEVFTNKIYAAIQHFGGTLHPKIPTGDRRGKGKQNSKVRKLMWAKFYAGGGDVFRGAALTTKNFLEPTIKIPARPFMVFSQTFFDKAIQIVTEAFGK